MPLLQIPRAVTPCQVEVPGSVEHRSREGSIHITPGVCRVTKEEWAHIEKVYPELAKRIHVVPIDESKSLGAKKRAVEKAKADNARPKPMLDKRAKDNPTRRERRLAELEARKAGSKGPAISKLSKDEAAKAKKPPAEEKPPSSRTPSNK